MKVIYSNALGDHNVRKIGKNEGDLIEVLGVQLNWKIKAVDTGYAFSVFEASFAPGESVPMHMHPYAEFFRVLEGSIDFARIGSDSKMEEIRCNAGECVLIPINAPHGIRNCTKQPARCISVSTYYHEITFNESGNVIQPGTKPTVPTAEAIQQFKNVSAKYQGYFVEADDSGRLIND